jgi:hypothetical protein
LHVVPSETSRKQHRFSLNPVKLVATSRAALRMAFDICRDDLSFELADYSFFETFL